MGIEKLEEVLPVVELPSFIRDEATFKYTGRTQKDGCFIKDVRKSKLELQLRRELLEGISEPNILNRPIVFLVDTNIPHTGIYILYGGQLYSVAYGYDTTPDFGSLYSIDIPLIQFSEARIVWVGILTDAIMDRLRGEFDRVTSVAGNLAAGVVNRLMFFHTPREYGVEEGQWDCTKWAMYILFGDRMPANFRDLVNPGLAPDQLERMITAYRGDNADEFMRVLGEINNASFPRGGRRRRATNNRNGMKRKVMQKTRKLTCMRTKYGDSRKT